MSLAVRGYAIVGYMCMAGLAVVVLFSTFGYIRLPEDMADKQQLKKAEQDPFMAFAIQVYLDNDLPVEGLAAKSNFGPLQIPYWCSTILLVLGAVMGILNLMRLGAFPSWLILFLFVLPLFQAVWIFSIISSMGSPAWGGWLALACPAAGVVMAIFVDSKKADTQPAALKTT